MLITLGPWSGHRHDNTDWAAAGQKKTGQTSTDRTRDTVGVTARRQPGELEGAVLAALWAARTPMSTGAIQQMLAGGLAHSTVATTLGRLIAKGHVERVRVRRVWMYRATRCQEEYASARMLTLLGQVTDQDTVLRHFVAGLSSRQVRLLRVLLEAAGGASPERHPADRGAVGR